jgi:hypothetical protein
VEVNVIEARDDEHHEEPEIVAQAPKTSASTIR